MTFKFLLPVVLAFSAVLIGLPAQAQSDGSGTAPTPAMTTAVPAPQASATSDSTGAPDTAAGPIAPGAEGSPGNEKDSYKLGAGDKVHVIVFGQDDLGGDFDVDGSGYIRLPLIGQIKAAGMTVFDFEREVKGMLDNGYLKDAKVSASVSNYRPFYIIGEVNKPGEYPYVSDMSVLNAVALAGGYTYRADDTEVFVRRAGSDKEVQLPADQTTKVNPGDIIRIAERFF
jgi:polysaccharide export outer membrane protein